MIGKKYLTPLVLLVVLLGLAGLAYWDENKTKADKALEASKDKLFSDDVKSTVEMSVRNVTAQPSEFKVSRDESSQKWSIVSPISYLADSEGVERLLKLLDEAKSERTFDRGNRVLGEFGLEPPQLTYELKLKTGKIQKLSIGGKTPTGFSSYAMLNDDPRVFLISQYIFTAANKTLTDLRDRSLGIPVEATRIEVKFSKSLDIVLDKSKGNWEVLSDTPLVGDEGEITKWLGSWTSLRVLDFIDNPGSELRKALTTLGKGSNEIAKIKFQSKEGVRELLIIENNDKYFTQLNQDTFVELDKSAVDSLKKEPKFFENRSLFSFASTDVSRVELDGVVFERAKGDWIRVSDKKPMPFIQSMLVSFEFAKGEVKMNEKDLVDLVKLAPLHTIDLKIKEEMQKISVWRNPAKSESYVVSVKNGYFEVSTEFVDLLKPKSSSNEPTAGGEPKGEKS